MRILLAHNYYQQPGGEDRSFAAHADLLMQAGHEVSIYTRTNDELNEIPALTAAGEMVWSSRSHRELQQCIRENRIDLVHFHNTFTRISPSAYYACKAGGAAVVQDLRNYRLLCPAATLFRDGAPCEDCLNRLPWPGILHGCWRDSRLQTSVVAAMLSTHRALGTWTRMVDRYIALTEGARQRFIVGGLPAEKVRVKPNFVTAPPRINARRQPFALYVGRLSEEKGIATLMDAWQKVSGIPLKVAGDGPLRDLVLGATRSLPAKIQWLKLLTREEIQALMAQAQFLIFPSICYEGMPRTILEAFVSNLPVIASNLGAMQEMITDGETGLLFHPGDASDLAAKVAWAQNHPDALRAIGLNANVLVDASYTPERNYQMLMDIYEQALLSAQRA